MDAKRFLESVIHDRHYRDQIVRAEEIPSREPVFADLDPPLSEAVQEMLRRDGIERLYTHQAAAVEAVAAAVEALAAVDEAAPRRPAGSTT